MSTTRYLCQKLINKNLEVIRDAALDVGSDGYISGVSGLASAPPHDGPVIALDGIVAPGLVNAHCHTPMTLMRSAGDGLALDDWLKTAVWPREAKLNTERVYWGQALGVSEMLLSGVTTHSEMFFYSGAIIRASEDLGSRLVLAPAIIDAIHADSMDERLDELADLHSDKHDPDGGVSIGIGPHSTYTLARSSLAKIAEKANELDTLVQIHLEETEAERQLVLDTHSMSATSLLAEVGMLDVRLLAAHGVWLSDADLDLLGEAGASVAHCPQSNLKLGSGMANLVDWSARGVRACLGTDGPASNDSLDLWFELKLAPGLARGLARDPGAMSTADAYRLATLNGAQALGLDNVGVLEAGYLADFILLDPSHYSLLPALSDDELLGHLVFGGSGRAVTDVWVGGRQVVANRKIEGLDHEQIVAKASESGAALL